MTISPVLGTVRPDTIIISVLLPHPEGPTIEMNSPLFISNETLSTAFSGARPFEEKTFSMPTTRTNGSASATASRGFLAKPVCIIVPSG